MGYDFTIREYSGPEKVTRGGGEREVSGDYFRLNIWGMGVMRDIMYFADALDTEADFPSFPEYPGDEHFDDEEPQDAAGSAFREALSATLQSVGEPGRIPAFKFGSNDGWIVTALECQALAAKLRAFVETGSEKDWKNCLESGRGVGKKVDAETIEHWKVLATDFADYAERAATNGAGFEVW